MTTETLKAAQDAHPVGKRVAFKVPSGRGTKEGVGVVRAHRDTRRGPFVTVRDDTGDEFSVRPGTLTSA